MYYRYNHGFLNLTIAILRLKCVHCFIQCLNQTQQKKTKQKKNETKALYAKKNSAKSDKKKDKKNEKKVTVISL